MAVKDDYQDFKNALNDLKMNNKASINFLTILAEDKVHNASQIVRAIEERILESKGDYVLPALYVLDSIVKNLRSPSYIQLFENRLPVIFASAFNKVDERTRLSMFKLRQTWPPYFSNTVLYNLDTRTHYIDPAWPITARVPDPSPSAPKIHINPDFIQRNSPSSTTSTNSQKSSVNSEDSNRSGNQTTFKTSDVSMKEDNYHMIPIDRKEINRSEIESMSANDSNDEQQQQSKTKGTNSQEISSTEIPSDKPSVKRTTSNEEEVLFGGSDIDYRDADQTKNTTSNVSNLDTDHLFKLNSECLSLAEEKYKSKELSSEEYQATLKLLQNILQTEFQRLTGPTTTAPSLLNNPNPTTTTTLANTMPTATPGNPFQAQPSLPFPSTTNPSLSTFPFAGFANDTQRHAFQILSAVGASQSYGSPYNFLPFLPPLPPAPAPPPFTLVPNTFTTPNSTSSTGRLSPSIKRPPDENSNTNVHSEQGNKRIRRDSTSNIRAHNFDEENIAPVPSLLDANINTLKKKYLGVIQQLYIGKYQCRLCGLRFSARQKHLYTHHLDWHYWENRQAATTSNSALLERCTDWYPSLHEWTEYEENIDEQIKNNQVIFAQNRQTKEIDTKSSSSEITSCPAKGDGGIDDDRCYVCHDPFENFFDDNREEWRLKDAIRIDGKTYHPICYQDVQYHETNDKPSDIDSSTFADLLADETSNQSSDSQLVDNAMATVNIKSENEETMDRDSLSSPEDSKPNYLSSMSFVNLAKSIYVKKEDLKPIENLETVSMNVKDELLDPTAMPEEIPFLAVKPETDCEFLIEPTSD